MRSSAGLIFFVAATALLRGQNPPASDQPISTDRPAVAESSTVVPKGSFQAENGFLITSDQGQSTLDGPETEMRFGVANNTELRLSVPDYYHDAVSGFGDLAIGIKQQLGPAAGFDVSIIAFLSIPTGAAAISSHGYDPGLQLPWSRKLSTNWTAAGQLALQVLTAGHETSIYLISAGLFHLLTHPDQLAGLIGKYVLANWMSLGTKFALPFFKWVYTSSISLAPELGSLLENVISSLFD